MSLPRLDDAHAHDLIALARQADADHASRVAAHGAHLALVEPGDPALGGGQDDVVLRRTRRRPTSARHPRQRSCARMPVAADALELLYGRLLDDALAGGHDQVVALLEVGDGDDGKTRSPDSTWTPSRLMIGMPLAWRLASGMVDLRAEHAPAVGEEQRPVVGVGDQQMGERVLLDRARADDALATAAWRRYVASGWRLM